MYNKHGHKNRYKLYKAIGHEGTKAIRRFSSLAAWKHFRKLRSLEVWKRFRKSRSLEVWKSGGLKRRLSWDFISPDFIKNLLPYGPIALLPQRLAFTMAEILISLTIIGVIAAITLPSLRANINEKAWATQRKALYSRLGQAISMLPSLNGYGIGANDTETANKATQAFITNGLATVLKINNVCDSNNLEKCGIPNKFTNYGGNSKINFPTTMYGFRPAFLNSNVNPQHPVNTATAAFEAASGESVAVFYNPYCSTRDVKYELGTAGTWRDIEAIYPYLCATFLFDLNGKKGPNKMGKDMWSIVSLYSVEPSVVMIDPDRITKKKSNLNFNDAKAYCASLNARMANLDEGIASFLSTPNSASIGFGWLSTDTGVNGLAYLVESNGYLIKFSKNASGGTGVRCIKR